MIKVAPKVSIPPSIMDAWKNLAESVFVADGDEKTRFAIALRSTDHADMALEKMILQYVEDSEFKERIDAHISATDGTDLLRFIAVTAYWGPDADDYIYRWRREILSQLCSVKKRDGFILIKCDKETGTSLNELIKPFLWKISDIRRFA